MKLLFIVTITSFVCLGASLAIDHSKFGLHFPSRINYNNLREMKLRSQAEIESIMPWNFREESVTGSDVREKLLLFPRHLLKSSVFTKLGFDHLNKDSSLFNLSQKYQNIVIPKDSKNLFIFNTTDKLGMPKRSRDNLVEFIDQSAPFSMPKFMHLVNYYAVIPKDYIELNLDENTPTEVESIYSEGILEIAASEFPIFRKCISENKPLVVFLFNSGDIENVEDSSDIIMNIKNYLSTGDVKTSVSSFFDSFAHNWIDKINYESLVQSVFCTTSVDNPNESYCLKVQDEDSIHLFPAFKDIARRTKNRLTIERRDEEHQWSAEEHQWPDEEHQWPDEDEPNIDDSVVSKEMISDTTFRIAEESLDEDVQQDSIMEDENKDNDNHHEPDMYGFSLPSRVEKFRHETFGEISKENVATIRPEGGFILPSSLLRLAKSKVDSPRKKTYAQVIFSPIEEDNFEADKEGELLKKRMPIYSTDENCDKITWYNIFHYSIFGKPQFCLD